MSDRHPRATRAAWAAAFAAVCAAGCGGREFAEVEGRVTLDGRPLADVEVVFLPDPTKGNRANNASAFADADGRYRLRAERDGRDGTVLGPHRVVVIDLLMVPDLINVGKPRAAGEAALPLPAMPGTKPRRFPTAYGDAADTPLHVEVHSGKQTLDFDLKSAGPGGKGP